MHRGAGLELGSGRCWHQCLPALSAAAAGGGGLAAAPQSRRQTLSCENDFRRHHPPGPVTDDPGLAVHVALYRGRLDWRHELGEPATEQPLCERVVPRGWVRRMCCWASAPAPMQVQYELARIFVFVASAFVRASLADGRTADRLSEHHPMAAGAFRFTSALLCYRQHQACSMHRKKTSSQLS